MKPSILSTLSSLRKRYGLDVGTLLRVMKASLPPTIAVAIYQANAISNVTTTVGYLTALTAVISQCLMPRGQFLKIMFFILLSTCTSAAVCCLGVFSAVRARTGSTPAAESTGSYNSSACAVAAVWLLFTIWISNTLRAYQPVLLQDPMVAFSIFSGVTLTHAAEFETFDQGLSFIRRLLTTFLLGFGVASGVSLLIIPISSRRNVFQTTLHYAQAMRNVFKAQIAYVQLAQNSSNVRDTRTANTHSSRQSEYKRTQDRVSKSIDNECTDQPSRDLKAAMATLVETNDKLANDLALAQTEIAWGMLESADLHEISAHLKSTMLSLSGISMLPDLHQELLNSSPDNDKSLVLESWASFLERFGHELEECAELVMLGLQHSITVLRVASTKDALQLAIDAPSRQPCDIEKPAQAPVPGSASFGSRYETKIMKFCTRSGASPGSTSDSPDLTDATMDLEAYPITATRGLWFKILFLRRLMHASLEGTNSLVRFADCKTTEYRLKDNRLLYPTARFSFLKSVIPCHDRSKSRDKDHRPPKHRRRDPEHLPANNLWERFCEFLGHFPRLLASDQSAFGFRATAAAFSVAILAYLRQTQAFFFEQRLIWVLIVIVLGMSPTSGASIFGYVSRVIATTISFAMSLAVWYIAVGHTPGVIVLLYLANMICYYFHVRYPTMFGPSIIAIVTLNVIIGYELQVNKLGIPGAESSGQPYYPVYKFGSYKLICVIVACGISLFWTVFPYPLSSSSQARRVLGRSLFVLANFYACMHATVDLWITRVEEGSATTSRALDDTKDRLFAEGMQLITALRKHCHLSKFDPPLGGRFPAATYNTITSEIQNVLISMALMAQTTRKLHDSTSPQKENKWRQRLTQRITSTSFNSHITTSLLCHLSAAVSNGQALPPYLCPPVSFGLARELEEFNPGLMDIRNANDASFSAFASLEVLNAVVNSSLTRIVSEIKLLVGEIKFEGSSNEANN